MQHKNEIVCESDKGRERKGTIRDFHKATSEIRFDSCGRNMWLTTCRKDFEFRHGVLKVEIAVEHTVKPKQLWHNSLGKTVKSLLRQKRPGRSVGGTHHTVRQRMENWQLERFFMSWQPVSQIKADN